MWSHYWVDFHSMWSGAIGLSGVVARTEQSQMSERFPFGMYWVRSLEVLIRLLLGFDR